MQAFQMVALMSLPATPDRKAVGVGDLFEAGAQERRDLIQMGRAEDAPAPARPAKKPAVESGK